LLRTGSNHFAWVLLDIVLESLVLGMSIRQLTIILMISTYLIGLSFLISTN
jgi:hypothetical protein